jgi:hypothetical protein
MGSYLAGLSGFERAEPGSLFLAAVLTDFFIFSSYFLREFFIFLCYSLNKKIKFSHCWQPATLLLAATSK